MILNKNIKTLFFHLYEQIYPKKAQYMEEVGIKELKQKAYLIKYTTCNKEAIEVLWPLYQEEIRKSVSYKTKGFNFDYAHSYANEKLLHELKRKKPAEINKIHNLTHFIKNLAKRRAIDFIRKNERDNSKAQQTDFLEEMPSSQTEANPVLCRLTEYAKLAKLSEEEEIIYEYLLSGIEKKKIAEMLNCSERTITRRKKSMQKKLAPLVKAKGKTS